MMVGDAVQAGRLQPIVLRDPPPGGVPAYLIGRFGPKPSAWLIAADDERKFEIGSLIYLNSDRADPLAAVGVVIGQALSNKHGALALIAKLPPKAGDRLFVRDLSGAVSVKLIDPNEVEPAAKTEATAPIAEPREESSPVAAPDSRAGQAPIVAELAPPGENLDIAQTEAPEAPATKIEITDTVPATGAPKADVPRDVAPIIMSTPPGAEALPLAVPARPQLQVSRKKPKPRARSRGELKIPAHSRRLPRHRRLRANRRSSLNSA